MTTARLNARMRRLEHTLPAGCPACRHRRGLMVVRTSRQQPDGTIVRGECNPPPCPRCGQVPEQILEIVEVVVETREDLERLAAQV